MGNGFSMKCAFFRRACATLLVLFSSVGSVCRGADCMRLTAADDTVAASEAKRGFFKRVTDYFLRSAAPDTTRRFDGGVLPGPHYSSTTGLGLGVVASGVYRADRRDTAGAPSNVSLYGDVTTKGFLMAGLRGNHVFPQDRFRMDYRFYVYTFPTEFYGIGFDACDDDGNRTDYRRVKFEAQTRFLFRLARNLYLGPMMGFQHVSASEVAPDGLHLFQHQPLRGLHNLSAGFSLTYDSRDFMLNAYRGWFVQLDQTFTPRFLGNDFCYSSTELTASSYRRVWRGAVLAGELHARFNYGNPAWCMLAEVGSGSRMRGYYEGRYRDKHIVEMQVELRQRVWRRHGAAVWLAAAQVFPRLDALRFSRILPNAGVGYRWEFKNRVNVRIDYGFTRNGGGFLFSLNEAF